jgi:hypothetical protein
MTDTDPNALDLGQRRGRSGLNRWGGHVHEEFHRALAGRQANKVYREMMDNDPVIGSIFHMVGAHIRGVTWRVEAADNDRPSAVDAAVFVEAQLEGLEQSWDDLMSEVLTMMPFGWSYLETVYQKVDRGRIGWQGFYGSSQDSLDEWAYDEADGGRCLGWWQSCAPTFQRVFLPLAKGLHFRTTAAKDNPEGRSLLRNAYRPWYFLKRIQEIEGIGIERDLAGLPVLHVPGELMSPNPTAEQAAIRAMCESLVKGVKTDERMGLVLPPKVDREGKPTGWDFSLQSSGGRRAIDTNAVIARYETRIAMTQLAQFLLLGSTGVGSFALADSHTNVYAAALGSVLDNIEATFHKQGTSVLCDLNGIAPEDRPRVVHGDIEKMDIGKLSAALQQLVAAGVVTPDATLEAAVREEADLPQHDPETATGAGADMPPTEG